MSVARPHITWRPRTGVLGYLCIAAATLFWGVSATLGRAVFTGRLRFGGRVVEIIPPLMLAQSRTTFALLVLLPLMLALRGRGKLRMAPRDARDAILLGTLGVAASNFFYYVAIQLTSVATAIILQYLAPAFVLLYMVVRGLQKATVDRVSGVVMAIGGSVLAIGAVGLVRGFPWLSLRAGQLHFNTLGIAAALAAAATFAFYNVFARHLVEGHDHWKVLTWALGGAAVFWLIINPPWKVLAAHYSGTQWAFMAVFSITSILIPFSLYFWGLQFLDATRAIVTSCLEPAFSITIAAIWLGEGVGGVQIAGILLVLAATVVVQRPERRAAPGVLVEPME